MSSTGTPPEISAPGNNQAEVGGQTLGERRVRVSFNVTGSSIIDEIKKRTAELIDQCEQLKGKDPRLAAIAQTAYEEAAMWAVKAATA